ncbi:unnamed protein product [Urochloa humidicola]
MDKTWIDDDARHTKVYLQGVNSFLVFALRNSAVGGKILCPCRKCVNSFWKEATEVREDLICDGFLKGYRTWNLHGEATSSVTHGNHAGAKVMEESKEDDDISYLPRDLATGLYDRGDFDDNTSALEPSAELDGLQKLIPEKGKELCPNCKKYRQLHFLVRLLHIKHLGGWTDRSFNQLLDLLNDALPKGSALPRNIHDAKKMVKYIGGECLGKQHCEIIESAMLKRDTFLLRPYGDVENMADAHKMPYKRLKVTKASQSSQGTAGRRS